MSNRNILWTQIFVDELARSGLKTVCIAPGSRSTALALAFAQHGSIKVYSHLAERSAAFFALGLALASDEPSAVICTSGSAAANFFPAIVEAHQSQVPLIVITSDRPHELRHSGANQTIDQIKMYGDYTLWSVDVALPEPQPADLTIRNLRTLANRAYATANGIRKGVVHINMPFRKPLEPIPMAGDMVEVTENARPRANNQPFARFDRAVITTPAEQIERIAQRVNQSEKGIIVCGPRSSTNPSFAQAVIDLSEKTGYPILADPISGMRFGHAEIIGGYDTFLMPNMQTVDLPSVVIRFGNVPTSRWLNEYLDQAAAGDYMHVSQSGSWSDDLHRVSEFVQADESRFCQQLAEYIERRADSQWQQNIRMLEQQTWATIDEKMAEVDYFDGAVVYDVARLLPAGSTLFMGNSLPIRHLDQFGAPANQAFHAYANRGASGIDGNISTALGAGAVQPDKPLVLVVGDVTFYHDMNGLLAVQRCGVPVTIVLLNNNGGGIFHRLPIKDFDPEFTDLFVTPHGLDFHHAARMYGLEYVHAADRSAFQQAFAESVGQRQSCLIEVRTDAQHDLQQRGRITRAVQESLNALKSTTN